MIKKESDSKKDTYSTDFFAMNTFMHIEAAGSESEEAVLAACDRVYELEALLSRTVPESEISKLNAGAGVSEVTVSEETFRLLENSVSLCEDTGGTFDVTIAPIMDLWGFSGSEYRVPSEEEIARTVSFVDYSGLILDQSDFGVSFSEDGMSVDLGAIAKGYASDCVLEIMKGFNIEYALINLGGNVCVYGKKSSGEGFRVAITDPTNPQSYAGILLISDLNVITSGGYERYFEEDGKRYIHIMDPATGMPTDSDLLSVSIVGPNGMQCDALSTALFVMGKEAAIQYWRDHRDFGCVLVVSETEVLVSRDLEGVFTVTDGKTLQFFE
jgi:thiamine biosynthesis lipoprotein